MTNTVTIYCFGDNGKGGNAEPHSRIAVAQWRRPWQIGDDVHDTWGPFRLWAEGGRNVMVAEFVRWVTDDDQDDPLNAGGLSLPNVRRLYRYRCGTCVFDYQRHTYSHAVDVRATHSLLLDKLAAHRIHEISARAFVARWERMMVAAASTADTPI